MATFTKVKTGWRVQVYKNGQRPSKVFATKAEAKFWAAETELELAGGKSLAASTRRVIDIFDRYESEVAPTKKGYKWIVGRLKCMRLLPLAKVRLDALDVTHIAAWRDSRLALVKGSTVNRELNLLSAMFNIAVKEWKWLQSNPKEDLVRPKDPPHRDRRITDEEVDIIVKQLGYNKVITTQSQLVAAMFLLALETGMRIGEISALRAQNVFPKYAKLPDTKNGTARNVPLSLKAQGLIGDILASGLAITADTAGALFRRAVRRSGIIGLTFHDSRHEACTRLARKLDVLDLARMIGHRDLKSLMIYYNATPSEIADRLG